MLAPFGGITKVHKVASGRRLCTACIAVLCALVLCTVLFPPLSYSQSARVELELNALTQEREMLSTELDQYQKTLDILGAGGTSPEQSSNPAVRNLAKEMVEIKSRIIAITEREVTVLQEQITAANTVVAVSKSQPSSDIESRPLRSHTRDYSIAREAENVSRLLTLISNHYTELQESMRTLPSREELALRSAAMRDAATSARIPFSVDKVRLSGSEGSASLAIMTQRLADNNIPESRRDIALICSIKTRLYGSLIASESRSLRPVGKNHYIAKIRLQPGDSTLRVGGNRWEVRLPKNISAADYLVTLYVPIGGEPEFHLFSIDDLLAHDEPHIPAWLPPSIELKPRAG